MDAREFVELVGQMRAAQKAYFRKDTRTQEVLEESRRLERSVDKALAEMRDDRPSLFRES